MASHWRLRTRAVPQLTSAVERKIRWRRCVELLESWNHQLGLRLLFSCRQYKVCDCQSFTSRYVYTLLSFISTVVFLKALFSVLYFLSCILPHSALSSPHFLLTITFMQMILNFFLVPSSQLWLKYRPPPDCSETHLILDVCKSSYS